MALQFSACPTRDLNGASAPLRACRGSATARCVASIRCRTTARTRPNSTRSSRAARSARAPLRVAVGRVWSASTREGALAAPAARQRRARDSAAGRREKRRGDRKFRSPGTAQGQPGDCTKIAGAAPTAAQPSSESCSGGTAKRGASRHEGPTHRPHVPHHDHAGPQRHVRDAPDSSPGPASRRAPPTSIRRRRPRAAPGGGRRGSAARRRGGRGSPSA